MIDGVQTPFELLIALSEKNHVAHAPLRHRRCDLELPLRYRATGETTWHIGRTENIGQRGVFFRGEWLLPVDSQVEMRFEVLLETDGDTSAEIVCQGEIARMVLPATPDAQPGLAARILETGSMHVKMGEDA